MKPGEDLIDKGLHDLALGEETIEGLLVSIGAPRLRSAGVTMPSETFSSPEHRLYNLLYSIEGDGAHSKYNALVRRLVSYERAVECAT